MQKVEAKMKCSIINCISLGSILRVKINDSQKKGKNTICFSFFLKNYNLTP